MEKGELWIVEFPVKKGKEQSGKRPGVVMADTGTSLALVIPLTSNLDSLNKLPFILKIKKSNMNKLEKDSVALVFQIQALDKKRFTSKIGNLEEEHTKEIDANLISLLKL